MEFALLKPTDQVVKPDKDKIIRVGEHKDQGEVNETFKFKINKDQ